MLFVVSLKTTDMRCLPCLVLTAESLKTVDSEVSSSLPLVNKLAPEELCKPVQAHVLRMESVLRHQAD